ncbi:MAG TPA: CBS domain-containing protein [Desulfobacteraceae bacterium]|nr:CBS domain-containing protein [Desulfobacteraceae bacterium]
MQVQNWMSSDVITVDVDASLVQVIRVLEENNIRHLPVTKNGKLAGMLTNEDVIKASPYGGTTLKAEELYHLLADMKAKHIMNPNPVCIKPHQTIEVAALMMLEHRITGIPVIKDDGSVIGIITQGDVFKCLVSITGAYQRGIQFAFNLEDKPGSIKEVANVIREEKCQVVSILSTTDTSDEGFRHVFIRIKKPPKENLKRLIDKLNQKFMLLYTVEDPLKEI